MDFIKHLPKDVILLMIEQLGIEGLIDHMSLKELNSLKKNVKRKILEKISNINIKSNAEFRSYLLSRPDSKPFKKVIGTLVVIRHEIHKSIEYDEYDEYGYRYTGITLLELNFSYITKKNGPIYYTVCFSQGNCEDGCMIYKSKTGYGISNNPRSCIIISKIVGHRQVLNLKSCGYSYIERIPTHDAQYKFLVWLFKHLPKCNVIRPMLTSRYRKTVSKRTCERLINNGYFHHTETHIENTNKT